MSQVPMTDPDDSLTSAEEEEFDALARKLTAKASFTPPPITGYRALKQDEIDLVNQVKALGANIAMVCKNVDSYLTAQLFKASSEETVRICSARPTRWSSIGETHFQQGLMALTRAVAQPTGF